MKIYLVTRGPFSEPNSYDAVVVIAKDEEHARQIHPSSAVTHVKDGVWMSTTIAGLEYKHKFDSWVEYKDIKLLRVTCIGLAYKGVKPGVMVASYYKL